MYKLADKQEKNYKCMEKILIRLQKTQMFNTI